MLAIVIARAGIASFALPDYALTRAVRLIRYVFFVACAIVGLYGFLLGMLWLIAHLASLESFKTPYLAPFTASEKNKYYDFRDTVVRFPLFMQFRRPRYATDNQKLRIRQKHGQQAGVAPTGPDSQDNFTQDASKSHSDKTSPKR